MFAFFRDAVSPCARSTRPTRGGHGAGADMAPKKAARGNEEPWSETPAEPWIRASRAAMDAAAPLRHLLHSSGGDRWDEYAEVMGDLGLAAPEPVARSAAAGSGSASSSGPPGLPEPRPGAKSLLERQADTYRELLYDCATRPANFDPRRHTIYVLGRPVQVPRPGSSFMF